VELEARTPTASCCVENPKATSPFWSAALFRRFLSLLFFVAALARTPKKRKKESGGKAPHSKTLG